MHGENELIIIKIKHVHVAFFIETKFSLHMVHAQLFLQRPIYMYVTQLQNSKIVGDDC